MRKVVDRLSASEARAQGRTKSQKQVREERGFTDAERRAARAWFKGQRSTESRSSVTNGRVPSTKKSKGAQFK